MPDPTISSRLAAIRQALSSDRDTRVAPPPIASTGRFDPKPKVKATAKPKASAPAIPADAEAMRAARERVSRADARARYNAVMASDAAKGREKQAADLLLASCDQNAALKTSASIIAELASQPTDAERAAAGINARREGIQRAWGKAADQAAEAQGLKPNPVLEAVHAYGMAGFKPRPKADGNHGWGKAVAFANGEG